MGYRSVKRRSVKRRSVKRRNTRKRGGSFPKLKTLKPYKFGSAPLAGLRGQSAPGVLERTQQTSKIRNPLIGKIRSNFNWKQANSTNPETRKTIFKLLKKKKAKRDSKAEAEKNRQIKLLIKHIKENPELAQKEREAAAQKIREKEEKIERKLALATEKNEELKRKKAAAAAAVKQPEAATFEPVELTTTSGQP